MIRQRFRISSPEYERTMRLATMQTIMAYVLADVAESFALDSMRNLEMIGYTFKQEEKQKWRELGRLVKLMDARLRSLTCNGYDTQKDCDYEESSDALYRMVLLICDRVGARGEIMDEIYQTIKEKFPPVVGLKLED